MKPLIVLVVVFMVAVAIIKVMRGIYDLPLAARIAMSAMLVFTAIGHFAFTKGMTMMLPSFFPFKKAVVYVTGGLEILAASALLVPALKAPTGWFLIIFFTLLLPANIHAAVHHVDYQRGTLNGSGLMYLWFRVPLQVFFIAWTYFSAIRF